MLKNKSVQPTPKKDDFTIKKLPSKKEEEKKQILTKKESQSSQQWPDEGEDDQEGWENEWDNADNLDSEMNDEYTGPLDTMTSKTLSYNKEHIKAYTMEQILKEQIPNKVA